MNEDDQKPPGADNDVLPPAPQLSEPAAGPEWSGATAEGASPPGTDAPPPASAYSWPANNLGGYPGAPGGWPPGDPPRGFVRRHPLLAAVIILLFVVATISVLAGVLASGGGGSVAFGEKIGVIKIEGVIMDSIDVVKEVHKFRDDDSIKAVVIRVDSPGGVVGPSQEIYSEVQKLAAEKTVVVSMGSVAASGGYYVACPAKMIYASPGTITGSIGVVMEMANLEGLFKWAKIKNVVIKSGEFKDVGSPYRAMTKEEKQLLQDFVDNVHLQFETAVAEGRGMDMDAVHELANGSIYSGEQALALGLVDEMGTMWDAIDQAAVLAGISGEPKVIWPPEPQPSLFELFSAIYDDVAEVKSTLHSPVRVMYLLRVN